MNLLESVNQNNVERVKELLSNNKTNVNTADNHRFTGKTISFVFLFRIELKVSFPALHHAVIKRNLDICRLLLNNKRFDSTVKSHEGCTALMVAVMANVEMEIIELLAKSKPVLTSMKNNEEVAPLHEAVKNRRLDIVKVLLEYGANVNDFDLDLENSLHLAASNSDYDIIEFLLNETEVDSQAKNRDEMNPLCLLLVRSRNQDQDLVARCFYLMLEHTYDKNPLTNTYAISDIFQCAFLACVYSHNEVVKYIIHNVYSINNSKYAFIRKLSEHCEDENAEFLYYILVFLHDDIESYDKFSFPRFSEINYFMCIRSVIHVMNILLSTDEAVELIITVLQHMKAIGFNIRVKEFEDQIGVLLHGKYASALIQVEDLEKVDQVLRYLLSKGFKLNLMVKSFLHSIAIARDSATTNVESCLKILQLLLHYATNFFVDLENWKQINDFKNLNPQIRSIIEWITRNFGTLQTNAFLEMHFVFSLKHFCRNRIREELNYNPSLICNHENLMTLGLPEVLINYIAFKE